MKEKSILNSTRRFGIEFEFLDSNIDRKILQKAVISTGQNCHVRNWEHTINNFDSWVAKTDSSCGFELCSPPFNEIKHIPLISSVLDHCLKLKAEFNEMCGYHIHVEVSDFSWEMITKLVMHWIKIEHLIIKSHPDHRTNNPYCKPLNSFLTNLRPNEKYETISSDIFYQKKLALNTSNFENRKTIEFRVGNMASKKEDIEERIKFYLWFIEISKISKSPSNLNWLNPIETIHWLKLSHEYELDSELKSMKIWFLNSLLDNIKNSIELKQIQEMRNL